MWITVLEVAGVIGGIATLLAFLLAPMFWLGSKIDHIRADMEKIRGDMATEAKDFHGRLCAIESERNKNRSS